jgi:MFS family permease
MASHYHSRSPNRRTEDSERSMEPKHSEPDQLLTGEKEEITEEECYEELGFSYSSTKKWTILTIIFLVQVSMNFNASLYSNAVGGISKEFHVSEQAARCGAMIFLIAYAFGLSWISYETGNFRLIGTGCELWAPWSEELGRKPILQASLLLVNIFQLPVALAKNFATIMVGRLLGGLSSAGGSVTLGMIADMWDSEHQVYLLSENEVFELIFSSNMP